jgi:N-acyl-D-amino-acid deacylase
MENNIQRAAYLAMSEENLERILALPYVCAGSDGISSQLDNKDDFVHPRAAGTFPTFFRMTSKKCGIAEAVRKMTSLPAQIYRIPQRGALKKGYFADIVIFDADKFDSNAGYDGKNQFPTGINKVFVNGKLAYDSQNPTQINRYGEYIPVK